MFRLTLVIVVSCASGTAAAGSDNEERVEKEKAALKGTWKIVSVQPPGLGESLEKLQEQEYRLVFDASNLTIKTKDSTVRAVVTLEPTKKPKAIDILIIREEKIKQTKYIGIYKLEGDILTICHNPDYFPRPTDFEPKQNQANKGFTGVLTFKRQKP